MVAVLLSIALIIASNRWPQLLILRQSLGQIVWPIQQTVDIPFYLLEQMELIVKDRSSLLNEVMQLKQKQIYLQAQNQKLRSLEAENQELRELLQSIGPDKESFFEARVIRADLDPFRQQIVINKGTRHGVKVGQGVIDAVGLVGMVIAVDQNSARVILLTDPGLSVPVQSVRSGERAIASGSGALGELRLNYVPLTADFMEGDQLVTSGLGGRYPTGYPVGVVTSIQQDPSTRFTLISLRPSAKLGQMRYVLLIKQPKVDENKAPLPLNAVPEKISE